jgi:hypothetical protein
MQIPMSKNNEHSPANNYEKLNAYNSENLNAQWSEDPNAKAPNLISKGIGNGSRSR